MMKHMMSRGGVALCLALAFTFGCDDPKKSDDGANGEKVEKSPETNGAVNEDAPTPEPAPTGLSDDEKASLEKEAAAEAAGSITAENLDSELSALEKELEAELAAE
jgi:hypothetical protein